MEYIVVDCETDKKIWDSESVTRHPEVLVEQIKTLGFFPSYHYFINNILIIKVIQKKGAKYAKKQ